MFYQLFIQIKTWRCSVFFILCIGLLISNANGQTKGKLLTPSNIVQKIAFVDHSRLRSEYTELQTAKDTVQREWKTLQQQNRLTEEDKKAWHTKKAVALQQYELKIIAAIRYVASRGGFTDVKPIPKDSTAQTGIDITNLILQKLNSKN
ncbi:hypothetical protein FAM09_25800 [Niastella caeni]|uniref:OmpH family outer membrane protein n=1 Tax=Niastella caeni TaxID=2569763 RepID=A0A4S8HIU4_9BACT|nr:hypothetical protein [Niastella caeni]THU33564.1 hypothetical protein FAM09_25800 [Niastella caeni]